jgi:2,5-diamino-6-(ribosylamino)-4(3H)-pyrimidinone 5'-phosphate reductase
MSVDGKIALPCRKQLRISSEGDLKRVFLLRNECDAILVGVGTILSDNPKLIVKESYVEKPKQPIRVVLDTHSRTPSNAFVVDDKARTVLFTKSREQYKDVFGPNIEIISTQLDKNGYIDIPIMLQLLYQKGVRSLLVEGGGTVIWNFIKLRCVDDLFVYIGPMIIGGKQTPTLADGTGIENINEIIHLTLLKSDRIDEGLLLHYQLINDGKDSK